MLISIVIPLYNESEGLELFHQSLILELKKLKKYSFEIIYVNDGSKDSTLSQLSVLAKKDASIKIVNLSRNFGKEIATSAGIHYARGKATMIMDGDGQHPTSLISEFLEKWHSGAQVIVGVRSSNKGEGFVKKSGSKLFYALFNSASDAEIMPRSTDFRLIDEIVQREFLRMPERNRITRGLIDWLGFKRDYIYFDSPERLAGSASYKTSQLVKLATNSFVSLSLRPLFFFGWVGVAIIFGSLAIGLFIIVEQFLMSDPLSLHFSGSVILGNFIAFLIGIVLVSQSMLAVYISHIHTQTQGRPLFVVNESGSINLR